MISSRNSLSRARLAAWPIALLLSSVFPATALAEEDPSAAETAAARTLAVDGLKLAKAGQCTEAVDKLERAEKLKHSAIVLGRLGECYVSLGKLVQGSEMLRKMLREPLPAEPTPALQQMYERAQQLVQETKPKIAGLTINLSGAKDATPTLLVDGAEVPATVLGVELPVDPGEHAVEVRAPGFLKAKGRATLGTGEKQAISLELKRDPNAVVAETAAAPAGPEQPPLAPSAGTNASAAVEMPPPEPVRHGSSTRTLGYVSYGVGAVGLGLGLVFGRAAMQAKDTLDNECPGKVCPPDQADKLDSAKTKGLVSTIGFGVGAAGVVLGTVLVIAGSSGESSASGSVSPYARSARSTFRPKAAIGLTSVQVGADF